MIRYKKCCHCYEAMKVCFVVFNVICFRQTFTCFWRKVYSLTTEQYSLGLYKLHLIHGKIQFEVSLWNFSLDDLSIDDSGILRPPPHSFIRTICHSMDINLLLLRKWKLQCQNIQILYYYIFLVNVFLVLIYNSLIF